MKKFKSILALALVCIFLVSTMTVNAAVAGVNETEDGGLDSFTELNCQVIANTITVSGRTPYADTAITFWVQENTEPARDLFYYQTKTDSSGSFALKFTMNPAIYDAEGAFDATLRVGGAGLNIQRIDDIELYSNAEMEGCKEDFTSITDAESFAAFFESYSEMLGVSGGYAEEEIEILNKYYTINPPTGDEDVAGIIAKIAELGDKLTRHTAMVVGISDAAMAGDSAEIARIITSPNNADIIADNELDFDTSAIIKEADMWARMINADGYATIEEIQQAFITAREEQFAVDKEMGGPATTDRENYFMDNWKLSNVANMLTISGAIDDIVATSVNIHVSGLEGGISTENEKSIAFYDTKARKADTDAEFVSFTAKFPMNTARFNGETLGVVRISAPNVNIHQFYITLYSQDEVDAMIDQFKAIETPEDLNTFIEDNKVMLEMTGNFSERKVNVMTELYGEKDFSDVDNSVDVVNEIVGLNDGTEVILNFLDALDTAAKGRWGQVQQVIEVTYADLKDTSTHYAELIKLTEKADRLDNIKKLYSELLDQEYATIQDIIDAYEKAYEDAYEAEQSAPSKPGGGGGGGGFTGGVSYVGGGSDSTESIIIGEGVAVENIMEIPEEELPSAPFADLAGYDWAKAAIDGLRQKAIIHGDGDGTFRPGATMTREEYLSVLLRTFGVEIKSGSVPFNDVDSNAWYADVIATAYELGVTNGMGNDRFGVGESIIRADMVVLAARLADKLQVDVPQKEAAVIFNDYTTVPSYAYESVVAFQQADFLNGDENGNFNPLNNTTRAEAATFFWNIYSAVK